MLAPGGCLVIIEPVFGMGALGAILALAKGEKRSKTHALRLAAGMGGRGYESVSTTRFRVDCTCRGYEEIRRLYLEGDNAEGKAPELEKRIKAILAGCGTSPTGELVLDYAVNGFVYRKLAVAPSTPGISYR